VRWWCCVLWALAGVVPCRPAAQPPTTPAQIPGEPPPQPAAQAPIERESRVGVIETPDLDVVFPGRRYAFLVPHVGGSILNALQFHQELFDWEPTEKTTVLLTDFIDSGNGEATTVPVNLVMLDVAPFSYTYETYPALDRMFWLANHEMVHIATMDQAVGSDLFWRSVFFGKVAVNAEDPLTVVYNYLTNPRWASPRWYREGIAVFLETWMAGGIGRAQGAYDEMVFRSMVRDGSYFYDVVGLESEGTSSDFQTGTNSYLYGTRFLNYLAYTHGPETVIDWTARRPGSKRYFAKQFEHVYGAKLEDEWRRWIAFEREWQTKNLAAIRENPTTPQRDLSPTALGSVSRSFVDPEAGKIYVAVSYPGQIAHLAAIDLTTGKLEKIHELKGPAKYYVTSIAFDPERKVFFFTSDNLEWRDLWQLELETGRVRRLANDFRTGDLAFNQADRSLWGIQKSNGASILVRIPEPYSSWQEVHTFPYGSDLYDIDLSPDGRLLTGGLAEIDGSQSLVLFRLEDLARGRTEPEKLFDFAESLAANFTFSRDGKNLYGSSYYSGVSNLYRYDLEKRDMFVLSNVETGLFRPQELGEGELFAYRYSGSGFVPVAVPDRDLDKVSSIRFLGTALADEKPLVREWAVGSPLDVGYVAPEAEDYGAVKRMRVRSLYPVLEGYKSSEAAGLRLDLADVVRRSRLKLALSYSPDDELESDEKLHADVELDYWKWNFRGTWNRADFYDLFGPTKKSRKGWSLGYEFEDILVYDDPRFYTLSTGGEHWGDLETLPSFQNIDASAEELTSAWAKIEFRHLRRSLGAVDDEKGLAWAMEGVLDYVESDTIPRLFGTLDRGWELPLHHSSIWLRGSAGYAFGDADDDFSRFFFGGFGNNYVDHLTEKRYREYDSFPGLEINEVGGRSFAKAIAEWNLPPVRFRKVGVPQLYLNWIRPALFAGVLTTDPESSALERTLSTVGAQLDFRLVLFSNRPSTLSLGYGVAYEGGESSNEVMLSLRLLSLD
jgi:hypothetical protein